MKKAKVKDASSIYCDLAAEEQLLAYIAFEDFTSGANIDENIFYGKDHKIIFEALKKVQSIVPKKLFEDTVWRETGADTYDDISETVKDVKEAVNPKHFRVFETIRKDLENLYLQREIITGSDAAKKSAEDGYLDDALVSIKSVLNIQVKQKVDTGNYVDDFQEREKLIKANSKKTGSESTLIPTGIIKYDKLSGGIQKGEVGVIVGEIGGGKSAGLLNFGAYAYLKGFNVHHFGLEMSRTENQFRMDSFLTDIPANLFRFAKLKKKDYDTWGSEIKKLKKERKNYFEFSSAKGVTVSEAIAIVEAAENKYGKKVDLALFDYLTLFDNESKSREFHMQQRETFIKLIDWAMLRQVGVWTASQSTDEGVKRKDGMRTIDVKYSRAIAEFAQIVIALYQGKEDAASGSLSFAVRKGRGFRKGEKITLKPDFSRMVLDTRSFALHTGNIIKDSGKKKLGRR